MNDITKLMIEMYKLEQLGYDFMGYEFNKSKLLSFHHLILSHQQCKQKGLGDGYWVWNGAILVQNTSHNYIHMIQRYDLDMFNAITSELIDENNKGYIDINNLMAIDDILRCFEKEYCSARTKKGNLVVKPEYTRRLIRK